MSKKSSVINTGRHEKLKRLLEERRREITANLQKKVRDRVAESDESWRNRDAEENIEAGMQDDIRFALLQMQSETLKKYDEVLARLENGAYGYCYECGNEITERRLRALPFAVHCKDCEEVCEAAKQRERWTS